MADPIARFDNGLIRADQVTAEPGTVYRTAGEAEGAARRVAAGDRDAVVVTTPDGFRVDTMDEVDGRERSRFRSNELYGANRNVAAFVTGRGASVTLRGTTDGSTAVDRVANVFTRAGFSATEARDLAMQGVSPDRAQALFTRMMATERPMNDFGPRVLTAQLLGAASRNPHGLSGLELASEAQRYAALRVVRPDGYVARLDTGEAIFRGGQLRMENGRARAGQYEVGQLLHDSGGVYREVDQNLRPGRLLGERPIETAFPVLTGATDMVAMGIYGIAAAVMNPREALQGLANAPARLASEVRNLPQTLRDFDAMSPYDRALAIGRVGGTVVTTAAGVGAIRNAVGTGTRLLGETTLNIPPGLMGMPQPVMAIAGGGTRVVPQAIPLTVGVQNAAAIAQPITIVTAGAWATHQTLAMSSLGGSSAPHEPEPTAAERAARQAELDQAFGNGRRVAHPGEQAPAVSNDARVASNPERGRFDAAFDGPSGYTRALERARIEAGDLGADTQVLRDPRTGTVIGERSADGRRGWRIDADHANWWDYSAGNKGTGGRYGHSFFPEAQSGPHSLSREYAIWESSRP